MTQCQGGARISRVKFGVPPNLGEEIFGEMPKTTGETPVLPYQIRVTDKFA